jgi:acetylornithine deacetylase/succinyl-diaminopimelate desuccinylase-like protein
MQERLESTLATLISYPSVSIDPTACHEMLDYVRSQVEQYGFYIHSQTDSPNPWFVLTTKQTKEIDTLLSAHLDIAPAPLELLTLEKREDKLYGRGVYDMKFAVACYLEFLKEHQETLRDLNIGMLFTTDEEISGAGTVEFLKLGWRPRRVLIPDGGDNWKIEEQAKGFAGLELTTTGVAGHGSRPWEADNAIHTLFDIGHTLREEYPFISKSEATFSVTSLHGGETFNQVPDRASLMLDFRSFKLDDITKFLKRVDELAQPKDVSIRVIQQGPPLLFDRSGKDVQDFLSTLHNLRGEDIEYSESYGGTDGRHFATYNIPCIIVEPRGGGRHALDEWLLAEDLLMFYRLIEQWLLP